jgi:hypothetical protein
MSSEEIKDSELADFCQWHTEHYGRKEVYLSAITTCICGHFHTYPREANLIINRLVKLGLLEKRKNKVYLK